jgi:tetratricopeptide (TPR) repeat protein
MSLWEPYAQREAALRRLDERLAAGAADIDERVARADLLAELGRVDEARAAYLEVLAQRPDHLAVLNNLGALVHAQGYTSAAHTLYAQAAHLHPHDPMSQVNLANSLAKAGERVAAQAAFEAALAAAPHYAPAHRGLALLASMRGDAAAVQAHLAGAFARAPVIEQPYRGAGRPIEVLLLISGLQGDIPLQQILDPAEFRVTALAPQFFQPDRPPAHDVILNSIGDVDLCGDALEAAARLVRGADRPVINDPARVLQTSRVENAARLGAIPGVVTAPTRVLSRAAIAGLNAEALTALGLRLPLAVRAPGFHGGEHFARVDRLDQLGPATASWPGDDLILMDFLDTRGADDKYRKYRAMLVGGRIHPLHLAVSNAWKVHYFTADMADQPVHRAEDAAFLTDMAGAIGAPAMAALERVQAALGLDYGGVDFALSATGELVVFEANATMVIPPPPPEPIWDYRRAPVAGLLDSAKAMIRARAARPGGGIAA